MKFVLASFFSVKIRKEAGSSLITPLLFVTAFRIDGDSDHFAYF